jgi:carboxyl-terminal processing protease
LRGTDNGQLTLTIGKYYRVTGESTQHRGVIPDIELPSMVDAETVGESARETALPWDRIQPTRFRAGSALDPEVQLLATHQAQRAAANADYRFLVNEIEAFEQIRSQKTISLNLAQRIAEREATDTNRLERENARRQARGLQPLASLEELDLAEQSEQILLHQAADIVAEMVALGRLDRQQLISGSESARPPASPQ